MPEIQRVDEDAIVNLPVDPPEFDALPPAARPTAAGRRSATVPDALDLGPLADIQRRRVEATRPVLDATSARMETDRLRAEEAYRATGIQPGELQPWDADANARRFRTDPLEAFGSLGSVFAMVASAFTRAPMENALNGAAAAMNSIRAGDEQNFTRAYEAWKANTDLAVRRHTIQNQNYQNAISMMNTNMSAGEAQMRMLATRFGDEQTAFFLENGLHKEAIDLQRQRADAMKHIQDANNDITQSGIRSQMWDQESQEIERTVTDPVAASGHRLAAWNRIYGRSGTPQQEAFGLLLHEMRGKPAEEIVKRAQELGLMPRQGILTRDRMGAEEIDRRRQRYERENIDSGMSPEEARTDAFRRSTREVDSEMARMTGGQMSTLEGQSDRYTYAIQTIDRVSNRIKSLWGAVGVPGYAQRGREIIGNLLGGTNSTEYQQVAGDIALLKSWANQNLLGRDSRPLSAEAANLNRVIQGLSLADTTQNTLKSYEKIRELYAQMQRDVEARRTRTRVAPPPGGPAAVSDTAAPARAPAWADAPLAQ